MKLSLAIILLMLPLTAFADDEYKWWFSPAFSPWYDLSRAKGDTGTYKQIEFNLSKDSYVYSLRAFTFKKKYGETRCILKNCNDKHDYILNERSFLIGKEYPDKKLTLSAGLGQIESEYNLINKKDFKEISIPVEITYTPVKSRIVGLDLGFSANLNNKASVYAFTIGMSLGRL